MLSFRVSAVQYPGLGNQTINCGERGVSLKLQKPVSLTCHLYVQLLNHDKTVQSGQPQRGVDSIFRIYHTTNWFLPISNMPDLKLFGPSSAGCHFVDLMQLLAFLLLVKMVIERFVR